jgi:uncharacterized protein YjcR
MSRTVNVKKCNARNRQGGPCAQRAMPNGKCYYHGGASTGAPRGNQNAMKHGIYASALLEHELEDYLNAKKLKSLTDDLAMARIRLLRAETVHKEFELKRHSGERIDADELERSFRRCDALARTVGHLEIQQVRVLEVRDMQEKVEALEERAKKYVGRGPRA